MANDAPEFSYMKKEHNVAAHESLVANDAPEVSYMKKEHNVAAHESSDSSARMLLPSSLKECHRWLPCHKF